MPGIKTQLAILISQKTNLYVEQHKIVINPPRNRQKDGIAFDVYATAIGGKKVRIFSFDTMSRCIKHGFDCTQINGDIELVAKQ